MSIITIPEQLTGKDELVAIPKSEYVEFLKLRSLVKEVKPTKEELKIIAQGEREIKMGKYESWDKVKHELERYHNRKS
ncbi:MAG: hypothetical protein A2817_02275 [Candidatus Yanofskybacteria bacterium RIFCSPHIGHO2_01_FULL_39_8b]|uniref:Uncharacterized protein n=1 Tax=Candidatus Yanofskybacteria bacterium RIFCSPHIGHO2_01_FULL_39_8b TaxID=1802659 RepID=A0A1F8EAN5_9BACT|nr:MAG: hypothetical protein A2817_02275 [Candidatus Yanofskybacteria bacterium RIFCSPHIGHO2_01_FULL_39_8b]